MNLYRNNITERGFIALGDAFQYNTSLVTFSCSDNLNCTNLDTLPLLRSLKYNSTLESLDIHRNSFGYTGVITMGESLKYPPIRL